MVEPETLLRRAVQDQGGVCERFRITAIRHLDECQRRDLAQAVSVMTGGERRPVAHALVEIASRGGAMQVGLYDDEALDLAVLRAAVDHLA